MKTPEQRIFVLEGSLGVFEWGLFSLVPPLGLFCSPLVLWRFFSLWSVAGKEWNPARRYLYFGLIAAFFGGLISLIGFLALLGWMLDLFEA